MFEPKLILSASKAYIITNVVIIKFFFVTVVDIKHRFRSGDIFDW